MSYLNTIKYKLTPNKSFPVIRGCGRCKEKTLFENTGCFRVNANKNKLDVWLIYQCTKCKHTYNLSIYERINPKKIKQSEYEKLLENNDELAMQYGTDVRLFQKNRAEIDWKNVQYTISSEVESDSTTEINKDVKLIISNAFQLKIPVEKLIAIILHVSRDKIRKYKEQGRLTVEHGTRDGEMNVILSALDNRD